MRNHAARELKLQPFLDKGALKVGWSQGGSGDAAGSPWAGNWDLCGRGSLCQDRTLGYEGEVGAWGVAWSPGGGSLTSPASLAIGFQLSFPKRQR